MELKSWRHDRKLSQAACAAMLRLAGGARTFQRMEQGETSTDADMVARIEALTGGLVTAADMHATRLEWLRANRPEKFADAPVRSPEAAE